MTAAMLARIGFSCISAAIGGIALFRAVSDKSDQSDQSYNPRAIAWIRTAVLVWCGLWAVIWAAIALLRLHYPFELEWAGGAMRDHCERIVAGLPLYVAPGPKWVPFEYPPLYFWVSAALMRLTSDGSYVPLRLVSIASTLGCCAVLGAWVRHTAPTQTGRIWSWIAPGIFLATYRFTGAWYDIERLDMLFLFFSLLGGFLLALGMADGKNRADRTDLTDLPNPSDQSHPSHWLIALSAVAFWLAFLTKQQAVLFLFGSAASLIWCRRWRLLGVFAAISAILCCGSVAILNRATEGWFGYYCFHVPLANGIRLNLAAQYFTSDLPLYAPIIVICVFGIWGSASKVQSHKSAAPSPQSLAPILAWCLMGVVGSLLSRAHWGGDQNVLMAGFLGIILAGCIYAAQSEAGSWRATAPMYSLAMAQLLTLVYRPDAQIPTPANRDAGERYQRAVRRLERDGEVLCLDHGGMSSSRHFHLMAMLDVIGSEKGMPPSVSEAIQTHRFAAILTDAMPEPGGAFGELSRHYVRSECLQLQTSWIATGFPTPGVGRDVWVLTPGSDSRGVLPSRSSSVISLTGK